MNCYDDWSKDFMDRAIDNISGRLHEAKILTEGNAWRKTRDYNYDNGNYTQLYFWYNMVSGRQIPITLEEYRNQSQPNL